MPVPPSVARLLLLIYPPSIRHAHGPEILSAWSKAWLQHRGFAARVGLMLHWLADAMRSWTRVTGQRSRSGRLGAAILTDIAFAFKRLRSRPASVLGTTLMLVVGVGLATTMFALSDPFLSRPLPYPRAEQLVLIDFDRLGILGVAGQQRESPLLSDWQARTDLFQGLAAYTRHGELRVRLDDRVVAMETMAVSGNLFQVLGVPMPWPAWPAAYDDEVWITSRGAGGPLAGIDLTGRELSLQSGGTLQVRAVLPSSFLMPQPTERTPVDALVELPPGPLVTVTALGQGSGFSMRALRMVARLQDGVTPGQAEAALNGEPGARQPRVTVVPIESAMKAERRSMAAGAFFAGVLVLMVCAANTLGMALTRGLYRASQVATMEVLGAGRSRIARILLAEGLLVTGVSLTTVVILVPLLLDVIVAVVPRNFIVLGTPALSWRVVAFAAAANAIACMAWWLGALIAWRRGARAGLRESTQRDGRMVRVVRFGLTAGQVAVTLVLLAGAALLVRSYLNLVSQDTGMSRDTFAMSASYTPELRGVALRDTIERTTDELQRLSGVSTVAAVVGQMADGFNLMGAAMIGRPVPVEYLWVSPEYFDASGMTFVEGRPPTNVDGAMQGAVVNETLVARYLDGRTALGEMVRAGGTLLPIVGVVKDARRRALDETSGPAVFLPLDDNMSGMHVTYLVAGTNVAAATWESIIHHVSPAAVLLDGATLRERLARTIQDRSFATLVVGLFAVATIGVTAVGLIGVVGYVVARRTREVGIRMALGAQPGNVMWLMMRDALAATVVGAVAGLVGAIRLSDAMTTLVYGISPRDWLTLAVTTVGLIVLAMVAAMVPARRAGRLSPTIALREE